MNKGKKFEEIIKRDFKKLEQSKITRLYDPVGGYGGISNVCDFIAYKYPNSFYFEAKETQINTFNLSKLTQYEDLLEYSGIKGLFAGVLVWFSHKNIITWTSIETIEKLKNIGIKSINCNIPITYDFELNVDVARKYPIIDFNDFINKINIQKSKD